MTADDRQLLRAATTAFRDGDTATLDTILDRLAAEGRRDLLIEVVGTLRLARPAIARILVGEADIDDAEQATLIKLHARLDSFAGSSRFRTWLFTVAGNEARMVLRHRSSRPGPMADPDDATAFVAGLRASSLIATRLDLSRAIDDLVEPYRSAVLLRDVHGLDYAEIARRSGCSVGTVSSRIARGRSLVVEALWRGR